MRLKKECGVTEISKANLDEIIGRGYRATRLTIGRNEDGVSIELFVLKGNEIGMHKFTGFEYGYFGEGPHGLLYLAQRLGIHELASIDVVSKLKTPPSIDFVYNDMSGMWGRIVG